MGYAEFFLAGVLAMTTFGIAMNTSWGIFMDKDSGIFYELLTYPITDASSWWKRSASMCCSVPPVASWRSSWRPGRWK
jgi:hypothetical protein